MGERQKVREAIDRTVRKTKKEKPLEYFRKTFERISDYLNRGSADQGYLYLHENEQLVFRRVELVHKRLIELNGLTEQLNELEKQQDQRFRQNYQ